MTHMKRSSSSLLLIAVAVSVSTLLGLASLRGLVPSTVKAQAGCCLPPTFTTPNTGRWARNSHPVVYISTSFNAAEVLAIKDAIADWNYENTHFNCSGVTVTDIRMSNTAPTQNGTWWIFYTNAQIYGSGGAPSTASTSFTSRPDATGKWYILKAATQFGNTIRVGHNTPNHDFTTGIMRHEFAHTLVFESFF